VNVTPTVSVVVVSHQRPTALGRCLRALTQLVHPHYEIIVAADAPGLATVATLGLDHRVKTTLVADAGISMARNRGLALAAGDVVAFIDDDAIAEPSWLSHLCAPFADPVVDAAGGFVRGRNGISFQWKARQVDARATHTPLDVDELHPSLHRAGPGRAIRTEGTNMAFRRARLAEIGGFDPAYRFYLDETDVNMRLAQDRAVTAIVPLAQVHHGVAPSAWRSADRAPRSLFDIGASTAVFLRKYLPEGDRDTVLTLLRRDQKKRLLRHLVTGNLEPRDIGRLMRDLDAGIDAGRIRALAVLPPIPPAQAPFLPYPGNTGTIHQLLAGRGRHSRRLRRRARELVAEGHLVTLFLFSPTALYHKMRYHEDGYWEQRGGLFGRADRTAPLVQLTGFSARVTAEQERLKTVRPLHRSNAATHGS